MDEHNREHSAFKAGRSIAGEDVIVFSSDLFVA